MEGVGYFLVLALGVASVLVHFGFITFPLVAIWSWAFSTTAPSPNVRRSRLFALGCVPSLVFPVAILVCGVVFASNSPRVFGVEAPAYPVHLIDGLLLVQFPLATIAVWWWRGQRRAVAASWVFAGYVSLVANFISTMSATGVWL